MKCQQKPYWCGPASLQNAFRCLGKKISQRAIAEACETSLEGTDEFALQRGITALGFRFQQYSGNWSASAHSWICSRINHNGPVLLCIDDWTHWVAVVSYFPGSYLVIDPARTKSCRAENHAIVLSVKALDRRWRASWKVQDGKDPTYYGIGICST